MNCQTDNSTSLDMSDTSCYVPLCVIHDTLTQASLGAPTLNCKSANANRRLVYNNNNKETKTRVQRRTLHINDTG